MLVIIASEMLDAGYYYFVLFYLLTIFDMALSNSLLKRTVSTSSWGSSGLALQCWG